MRLTKQDIEKLKALYTVDEDGVYGFSLFSYDDLTPNLQAYADWFEGIEEEVHTMAKLKKYAWYGGNGYQMALNDIMKHDKPPRLSYNTKAEVDENDFTSDIVEKIRTGEWN